MTQSTYFNQVKNVLKVLQGYTKGIRFLLVMLLTLCVSAEVWGAEYEKYSGAITEGDYLIVYSNGAMKNTVSSSRLQYTEVTVSNNKISNPDAFLIWHIAPSGDYWTIYNASVDKYAAGTGAKSKAQLLESGTDNKSLWTVSGTSTYEFVNKANKAASVNSNLRRNGTYGFACYATSTGGALTLYKKVTAAPSHTITATSNNDSFGTVSVSGTTITATPKDGYRVSTTTPYAISPSGSATVTQNGNTFIVTPSANTEIIINFEAIPKYTVTWNVNGEVYETTQVTEGIKPTFPATPSSCDATSNTFYGWATAKWDGKINDVSAKTIYTSANNMPAETATYHAVFCEGSGSTTLINETFDDSSTTDSNQEIGTTFSNFDGESNKAFKSKYGGVKFGNSSNAGYITSKSLDLSTAFTVTLDACKYGSDAGNIEVTVGTQTKTISNSSLEAAGTFKTFTLEFDAATSTSTVKIGTSSKRAYIDNVIIATGGGASNFITTCATASVAPIATIDPTYVTATAAGAEGKVTVTYENVNTANVSVALYNDDACTETFTAGWLTASIDADKNITYTVAENTTYAERKAYIQLTAPETTGAIDPDVVVIPVTQAGKDKVFASLEALLAAITPTTEGVEVTVTLTNEVIQDFYTSGSYRNGIALNVPYQDGVKVIEIYCKDVPAEWVKGGKVSGTITCPWKLYNSTWELCPTAWTELTYTAPPTVSSIAVSGTPTKTTYVDGEEFDPAGLVVTATYTDASTETVNAALVDWTFNPETLSKGVTSVSVVATYNTMASTPYVVTGLTVNDIPTKTVAEFIAAEGGRCYLEGIVSNITNTTYGNFDLTDASGKIYVYGCLNGAGESKKFAELGVKNGDKIKVIADEYELYGGTKDEAKNVQYVSHISPATISIADITIKVGETKTIEATITPDAAKTEVQYEITSGSECITLDGNTITAIAAGTATIVATIAEKADEYQGITMTFTVTVPTTYDVTWLVNGDEWATTEGVEKGTQVASLPSEPTDECGGKAFVGWSTQTVTDGNKPAVLFTDAANSPIITTKTTFHAVFADKEGDGESGWQKVIATDEVVDGGIFALLTYDEAYYLANAQSTSDPLLQPVTKQDGKITVTDEMKWRATAVGGGFTFTSYNNANYYLWGAHANDGIRINTESTKQSPTNVWSIELSNDYGVVLYHNASDEGKKYLSTYGDNDWRNYLISNINENNRVANLYKEYIGSTYSDYTTSCLNVNWTISEGGTLSTESGITTTVMPEEGYIFCDPAYTITHGSATVTQNGNIFTAVPTTDCTIQINMVQKTTYTVTWMVNGKEYTIGAPSTTVYADERVATLPTPPEPNAYCGDVFVGWTTENPASGNFNEAPTVYNEQSAFPTATGDQTFYAVFADYEQQ